MFDSDMVSDFRRRYAGSIIEILGVQLLGYEGDTLTAGMTVNDIALNSQGFLHGGVSPFVAETLASFASLYLRRGTGGVAGVSVFASHLEKGRRGDRLTFLARPVRKKGKLHVWIVEMRNDGGELLSSSQVTVAIVRPDAQPR